jgi:polysaccharide export outer membrane protein
MSFRPLLIVAAIAFALAGCAQDPAIKALPPGASLGVADPVKAPIAADYKLWPNDIVDIEVFEVPNLHRVVQLDAAGTIDLPLIGQVPAGGRTAIELSKDLETRYGAKWLKDPQITVMIKQARQDTVVVDGSVQAPGVFPVTDGMSLIRAIALAKGTDTLADPKHVVVFRTVHDQRVAGVFDLTEIRSGKAADPPIFPNDTIVVASSSGRRTLRDIVGLTPIVGLLPLVVP